MLGRDASYRIRCGIGISDGPPTPFKADLRGVTLHKANLRRVDLDNADLGGADLHGADLSSASLCGASLRDADLSADLSRADLTGADLSGAKLTSAYIFGASLRLANLVGCNLQGANLREADLRAANLRGSNLTDARLEETNLAATNLTDVRGLDSCTHVGPSTIDHRTLLISGRLPLAFLRGCGLPDQLIEYLPSLLSRPVQFYSCFISYATKDQEFADRLHADLQDNGVRCWFAPHKVQGGQKLHEQIDEAIRIYDRLLLIISQHSMDSEWVMTEVAKARRRERQEKRRMLFPVRLVGFDELRDWECFDADTGKDSAREIREYFVPDFSNWKDHDAYRAALNRLLTDLRASDSQAI